MSHSGAVSSSTSLMNTTSAPDCIKEIQAKILGDLEIELDDVADESGEEVMDHLVKAILDIVERALAANPQWDVAVWVAGFKRGVLDARRQLWAQKGIPERNFKAAFEYPLEKRGEDVEVFKVIADQGFKTEPIKMSTWGLANRERLRATQLGKTSKVPVSLADTEDTRACEHLLPGNRRSILLQLDDLALYEEAAKPSRSPMSVISVIISGTLEMIRTRIVDHFYAFHYRTWGAGPVVQASYMLIESLSKHVVDKKMKEFATLADDDASKTKIWSTKFWRKWIVDRYFAFEREFMTDEALMDVFGNSDARRAVRNGLFLVEGIVVRTRVPKL